jgi:hypothetical protein
LLFRLAQRPGHFLDQWIDPFHGASTSLKYLSQGGKARTRRKLAFFASNPSKGSLTITDF